MQTDQSIDGHPLVRYERRNDVGLIFLCDTKRRNALCAEIAEGVLDAFQRSRRDGARAVVLASEAEVFCAGADIREMRDSGWLTDVEVRTGSRTPVDLFEAIETDGRPVVAAVNGLALGGGVELVLSCDMAVAASDASFALPELGLGVLPNTAIGRLPALVGQRAALELIWMRKRFKAPEAARLGIVNSIVEPGELLDAAVSLAEKIIAGAPPAAIAATKRCLSKGMDWRSIRAVLGEMHEEEWHEGFSAFLDKRVPNYEKFWSKD